MYSLTYIFSQRHKRIAIFQKYAYHMHRDSKNWSTWNCVNKHKKIPKGGCEAGLIMDKNDNLLTVKGVHCHEPDLEFLYLYHFKEHLKDALKGDPSTPLHKLYQRARAQYEEKYPDAKQHLPSYTRVSTTMCSERQRQREAKESNIEKAGNSSSVALEEEEENSSALSPHESNEEDSSANDDSESILGIAESCEVSSTQSPDITLIKQEPAEDVPSPPSVPNPAQMPESVFTGHTGPIGNQPTYESPNFNLNPQHRMRSPRNVPSKSKGRGSSNTMPRNPNSTNMPMNPNFANIPMNPNFTNMPMNPNFTNMPMNPNYMNMPMNPNFTNMPMNPNCMNMTMNPNSVNMSMNHRTMNMSMNPNGMNRPMNPGSMNMPMNPNSTNMPMYPNSTNMPMNPNRTNMPMNPNPTNMPMNPNPTNMPMGSGPTFMPPPGPEQAVRSQFQIYGEYIAGKLSQMDSRTAAYVQKAIGDIIFDAEMGKFKT